MEEVTKDSGHRASVSMPSLDATDDFPSQTTPSVNAEDNISEFVPTDATFVSTASTETIASSSDPTEALNPETFTSETSTVSEDTTQPVQEGSSKEFTNETLTETPVDEASTEALPDHQAPTEALIDPASTEPLIEETSTEPSIKGVPQTLISDPSSEQLIDEVSTQQLIDEASTEAVIGAASAEPLLAVDSQVLHQEEGLDDSQGEEDPSIAIDQFIKKIADEQLSSKRMEERKEEEAKEQRKDSESEGMETDEAVGQQANTALEENAPTQENKNAPSSLENTLTEHTQNAQLTTGEGTKTMEGDNDINTAAPQFKIVGGELAGKSLVDSEDNMMESIEEIQKEINRIPVKKTTNKEDTENGDSATQNGVSDKNANQNENHTQESIEQMLEEDFSKSVEPQGDILKNALKKSAKEPVVKEPSVQDSSDVARDPQLIEKAQEELKKLDVLVCGECHNTFYYAQEFMDHKRGQCLKKSVLTGICENEGKPQVWGFILWKIKQTKDLSSNVPSSWSIYQRWCKLPQEDKNAWITAGQSIQFASKVGNARVTEIRPTRQTVVHKVMDKESPKPPPPIEFVDSNKENSSSMQMENTASNIIKRGISKPVKLNNDVTIMPSTKNASITNSEQLNSNKAVRTTKILSTQKEEYVVEKIMAKRFNPRKKTWEYNIKWENFGHDSNTWEPISNLSHCKIMLEQFEEQLKRMKEEKAKQAAMSPKGRGRPSNPKSIKPNSSNFIPIAPKPDSTPKISNVVGGVSDDYAGGSGSRPQRSSKQKALNQVKQWCGNISDEDSGGAVGFKRKLDSDSSDEDYDEKRVKLEEDSDYSDKDDIKPKISIKKVSSTPRQTPIKNGNPGAQQVLPSNILIPDANGVVRINQKQLPSLSSGVYIMSKTAGIIKLDSTTSKVATSGGQTIVKVAPKIGQTQIKIVKKDGNTTKQIIQVSPKPIVTSTPVRVNPAKANTPNKFTPKIRKEVKKAPPLTETMTKLITRKPEVTVVPPTAPQDDESDDGLEPLPFPGPDEPIPDLDDLNQDNEEFVLDPTTGKIAGVEYVDKPVVIKEEPQPGAPSTNDLENIVKLAAAEITESDSQHSDSQMELEDPLFTTEAETKPTIVHHSVKSESSNTGTSVGMVRKVVKYTTAQGVKTESSILNKVLTTGPSTQRAIISPVKASPPVQVRRTPQVQQKVLNQMVSRTPNTGQARTVVRHVIGPQRSAGGNLNVIRKTISPAPRPKFNLSPQRPLPSPLQPTRTYSAMGGIRQQQNAGPGSKVQVYSTKSVAGSQSSQVQGGVRRIGNTVVRNTSSGQVQTVQKQQPTQYNTQRQPVTRIVQRVVTSPKKPDNSNVVNRVPQQQIQQQPKVVQNTKPKAIISMPSLTDEEMISTPPPKPVQKPAVAEQLQRTVPQPVKPVVQPEPPVKVEDTTSTESPVQMEVGETATDAEQGTDWSSFTMADGDNPIYVTGDDGTIYQVAGQNEQGQTILITQGPDGQQQCLLVTNEIGEMASEDQASTSTANTNIEAEAAVSEEATAVAVAEANETEATVATSIAESVQTPLHIKTDAAEMEGIEEGVQDQVVAQVVRAEPPSPGGTHKVVVMLPDGNLMVTQVSPEEYASLELE